MKRLPVGIQNFREIIEDNHVYIDKTMFIHQLINNGKCYFLSRPRRFGKSLFLDTIAEVFKGSKELFKGLWIYDSDYDFKSYPIVRIDMSIVDSTTLDRFERSLSAEIRDHMQLEDINIIDESPTELFKALIRGLYRKYNKKVVVLIDEYDKPILDHISEFKTAEANRAIIKNLYGILKPLDSHIEFIFLTGVSKFTKTSVFSNLNNLSDITMQEKYANICGIPVNDLETYFGDRIKILSEHKNFKRYENLSNKILEWYDGYSWDGKTKLLNPYGLLSFFQAEQIKSFWYASGTPTFLIELIKNKPESVPKLENLTIAESALDAIDIQSLEVASILFQTGYLTVAEVVYPDVWPEYILKIPNFEVREAFFKQLTAGLTEKEHIFTDDVYRQIKKSLKAGDLQSI